MRLPVWLRETLSLLVLVLTGNVLVAVIYRIWCDMSD